MLGIMVLGFAIARWVLSIKLEDTSDFTLVDKLLSIMQTSLGILFLVVVLWYLLRIEPRWNILGSFVIEADGGAGAAYHDPAWSRLLIGWKITSLLVGVSIAGLGITMLRQESRSPGGNSLSQIIEN
jgi:hypothetical protein